ncbi:MAG TPA: hypothetical protein ENK57_19365 [Polyangiaceae bacterium]|nr:hypothetical protein [Polyangiaceae bacterium]
MDRRGYLLALGAAALIAVGIYIFLRDRGERAADARPSQPAHEGGSVESDPRSAHARAEDAGAMEAVARFTGDAGAAVSQVRALPESTGSAPPPDGIRPIRGLPREDPDADRSSGWRLGQARRRIALLEARAGTYQEAVDRFVEAGNAQLAERQRAVLERVQGRIAEFRSQESELLEAAEADGTMDEVAQGYEQGERTPSTSSVSATPP